MYKKEDMKFLNMRRNTIVGKEKVFEIENELVLKDKIKFIDEIENNVASYLLNILTKWENEKDSLSKDSYNNIKTVSKKAWIKRNDERKIIDIDYKIGKYFLFGTEYKTMSLICPYTEYGYRLLYTDGNVVNQWFHDLCIKLYLEEKQYFESVNPVEIKISQVKKCVEKYHVYFDSKKVNDIAWNNDKNITEKELDIYLDAYKKIEDYIVKTTKDVQQQIDNYKNDNK